MDSCAPFALGRRDVLRGAGLAAGAAAFGSWGSAHAQETFVWYTGIATEASDAVSKQFTEKTGIPVERETLELCREGRELVNYCAAELDAVGEGLKELRLDELAEGLDASAAEDS
jgi:exodeoxyribonuclease VII small subunit